MKADVGKEWACRLKTEQILTFKIMIWRRQTNLSPKSPIYNWLLPLPEECILCILSSPYLIFHASNKNKHFPQSGFSWSTPATNYSTINEKIYMHAFFFHQGKWLGYYKELEVKDQEVSESQSWNAVSPARPLHDRWRNWGPDRANSLPNTTQQFRWLLTRRNTNLHPNWLTQKEKLLVHIIEYSKGVYLTLDKTWSGTPMMRLRLGLRSLSLSLSPSLPLLLFLYPSLYGFLLWHQNRP